MITYLPPNEARYDYVIDEVELEKAKNYFTSLEFLETVKTVSSKPINTTKGEE